MSEVKLLPCPFCGGKPNCHYDGTVWHVRCKELGCASGRVDTWEKDHAVAAWNTRAASPDHARALAEKDRVIERLRETLERYGKHLDGCAINVAWDVALQCNCGFDASLAQHEQKEGM